jgi:3-hydroxyacyl-[acyl-carrier-protein] dehydratase
MHACDSQACNTLLSVSVPVFLFQEGWCRIGDRIVRLNLFSTACLCREVFDKDLISMANKEICMDIQQIMSFLPHRYPFLLIDRVMEMEEDKRIVALKNVTINEPFFNGHFPGVPVMPGVLMIEAMAQAGGVLLFSSLDDKSSHIAVLLGVDKCRFRKPVRPGDQLVIEVNVLRLKSRVGKMAAKTLVDGKVAAEAEIIFSLVDKSGLTGSE